MKVYVVTSCEPYGDETTIESIWFTPESAEKERRRIAPDKYGTEVEAHEVQSEVE